MRNRSFLFIAASALIAAGFVGCGDGEEGAGGGTGGTGGAGGTGGTGGTGGDASAGCPDATFTSPTSGSTLTVGDDKDNDCSNGIQVDVTVATDAAAGTSVKLLADGAEVGSASVSGATATFTNVQLKSSGTTKLAVRLGADSSCDVEIAVDSKCSDVTCDVTKPVLSATHPKLNGVPVSQGGDRVSADGQDYQAAFEVTTNIQDGQPVTLTVDGNAGAAIALAQSGVATFPGVTLKPDGDHKVSASCKAQSGSTGASAEATYPVDSTPPDLTNLTPADGQFFGPADDSNTSKAGLQFEVCGETTAADAIDLPPSLGSAQSNYCVSIGTASPACAPATATGANGQKGGCVELDCPGGAPFDLEVTLKDDAGNPKTHTITGVRCASSLPSVQIVEPIAGTGADVTTHILAATATQTRKDQDANTPGAQYTVIACTDIPSGKGTLKVGLGSGTPATKATATAVPATAADNCPTALGHVLKFTNATLDESQVDANTNALTTATRLVVEVEDVSTAKGVSPAVDVWVDSTAPNISQWAPNDLCGKFYQSATSVVVPLFLLAENVPINVTVTNSAGTQQKVGSAPKPGVVNVGNFTFEQGANQVAATTTEPSGNAGALQSPCTVTVGNPPVVTWTAPNAATQLNAATDGAAGTAGWQGSLSVQTDVGGTGATVTFEVDCGGTITALGTVNVDAAGVATLANATLPECASAKISAKTSNVSGKGVGSATLTKPVDTIVPGAPTAFAAAVKDRRQTSFGLTWTAPADGGQPVGGYQIRVAKVPIGAANFDAGGAVESVSFGGTPKAPGGAESIDVLNRIIENDYYFAIAATDSAGNRSSVVSAGPTKALFNTTVIAGSGTEGFGFSIDGSASINGDALADMIVGSRTSTTVRVYFGTSTGYPSTPNLTFTGTAGTRFGFAVAVVGDIDADTFADIAISAPLEGSKGRVYIFKGRASWPATLSTAQADYTIDVDSVADPKFASSQFGYAIAPLGDFDADGAPDFAVTGYVYGGGTGYVAIIKGGTAGAPFTSVTLPAAVGTKAYALTGDAGITPAGNWFGWAAISLSGYYPGGVPALVVSAPGANAGLVYSYKGGAGLPANIGVASAFETYAGSGPLRTGTVLANLAPGVGVSSPATSTTNGGDARLFGTSAALFGVGPKVITNSAAQAVGDQFGYCLIGGGFSGSTVPVSFIGGSDPDVAVSSIAVGGAKPTKLYILDGSKITGNLDVTTAADVTYTLPAGWLGSAWRSAGLRDSNGDGYAEIAVGEQQPLVGYPGQVIVLW